MKKKWVRFIPALMVALTASLAIHQLKRAPEPVYRGKSASAWFDAFTLGYSFKTVPVSVQETREEAIPDFIPSLSVSPWSRPPRRPSSEPKIIRVESEPLVAFRVMGKTATGFLLRALRRRDPETSAKAARILAALGDADENVLTALIRVMQTKESVPHQLYRLAWENGLSFLMPRLLQPSVPSSYQMAFPFDDAPSIIPYRSNSPSVLKLPPATNLPTVIGHETYKSMGDPGFERRRPRDTNISFPPLFENVSTTLSLELRGPP